MNNFKAEATRKEYFLKIAPDFSVLDIAEKFMLENKLSGERELFYYKENTDNINDCTFKRGLFRIKKSGITIFANEITSATAAYITFQIGSDTIAIAIDNTSANGINLNFPVGSTIIGVAF